MRIAIVSDIHGNVTALDAVLRDLREASPDLILLGGDISDAGSSPVEVVDQLRALGWPGVMGNTDEMLVAPESLEAFAAATPAMQPLLETTREMAAWTRDQLGNDRLTWLRSLPRAQSVVDMTLVHASPESCWRSPGQDATEEELATVYGPLRCSVAVFGHIHHPFIRRAKEMTVANSGSVSLSYDGDPRASYLLLDDFVPSIRRISYDVERERKLLAQCGLPHAEWVGKMLAAGGFVAP